MQVLLNGFINGLTIALLALAFETVYLPTRVFHVALGATYTASSFVAWECLQRGWPLFVAVGVALLCGAGLSILVELVNHWPLEKRRSGFGAHMISSLGAYIVIIQTAVLIWGNETKVFRSGLDDAVKFGDVVITGAQTVAGVFSVTLIAAFCLWLQFTYMGLQFRALAENPVEFALRGYNVRRTRLVAFGISGVLAAAGALVVANDIGFDPNGGLVALLVAVVAMIIGGRLSFTGALLGGLILGLVRSLTVYYFSAKWQEAVTFMLLAAFLFILPNGIFGRSRRLEAEA